MTWELNCTVCARSSYDGQPDDVDGDRCGFCGQLPALELVESYESMRSFPPHPCAASNVTPVSHAAEKELETRRS